MYKFFLYFFSDFIFNSVMFNTSFSYLFEAGAFLNILFVFSFALYLLGMLSLLLNVKNILVSLLSVELVYFGCICFFLVVALVNSTPCGFLYALCLIIVAAAESAVGLGLLILVFTFDRRISFDLLVELRG